MVAGPPVADWRNADAYAALAHCDRHGFAWEWLRRSSSYRLTFDQTGGRREQQDTGRFGLHRFEPPDLPWPIARLIWHRGVDDTVLTATALPIGAAPAIDIRALNTIASYVANRDGEHWLLADRGNHVRIDLVSGSLARGPVGLQFHVTGYPECRGQIAALQRLVALSELGRWPTRSPRAERRAPRWALILRVHDAIVAGASHREIAECLFDLGDLPRWRVSAPSWRRRVQRLTDAARQFSRREPKAWLSAGRAQP